MFDGSWTWGDWLGEFLGLAVLVLWIMPGIYLAARGFIARGGHGGDEGHVG